MKAALFLVAALAFAQGSSAQPFFGPLLLPKLVGNVVGVVGVAQKTVHETMNVGADLVKDVVQTSLLTVAKISEDVKVLASKLKKELAEKLVTVIKGIENLIEKVAAKKQEADDKTTASAAEAVKEKQQVEDMKKKTTAGVEDMIAQMCGDKAVWEEAGKKLLEAVDEAHKLMDTETEVQDMHDNLMEQLKDLKEQSCGTESQ